MERIRGQIYFCPTRDCLVYRMQAPTAEYWDALWRDRRVADLATILPKNGTFITRETLARLGPGARVLEGGCGTGIHARYLAESGFKVTALDWAADTVTWLKQNIPSIDPVEADLRDIPVPDGFFDGYWSLGVIEHFYDGYGQIVGEMARVIRSGGYLFLTFPHMSLARRLAVRFAMYPRWNERDQGEYYQFALRDSRVVEDLADSFELVSRRSLLGASGLGDMVPALEPVLEWLRRERRVGRKVVSVIDRLAAPIFGHVVLLVLRRK